MNGKLTPSISPAASGAAGAGAMGSVAVPEATNLPPVWQTVPTVTFTEGVAATYDVSALVADPEGDVLWEAPIVGVPLSAQFSPGGRIVFVTHIGRIYLLDRATGEVRWEFDTVQGEDLWGNDEVNSGGGAWYPPAVDLDRGLVYVNNFIHPINALDTEMFSGRRLRSMQPRRHRTIQNIDEERGLSGSRNAGHADESLQRNFDRDIF